MEQLSVAEDKLGKVMARLLGIDVFAKKLEMDEERFVPEGLGYKTDLFEEEEKVKYKISSSGNSANYQLKGNFFSRRRKMWRADQRKRKSQPEVISRDNPTSFWMPRAGARGEAENDNFLVNTKTIFSCFVSVSSRCLVGKYLYVKS